MRCNWNKGKMKVRVVLMIRGMTSMPLDEYYERR
jgi:hypothetical protein